MKVRTSRILLTFLVCSLLFSSMISVRPLRAQGDLAGQKILISLGHGEADNYLVNITAWITAEGGTYVFDNDTLTASSFDGVTGALIGCVYTPPDHFTQAEANVIRDWFTSAANNWIWVAGDSDYDSGFVPGNASMILETVGSALRMEPSSIEDPKSNCGSGYRVVANWTTPNAAYSSIVSGIQKVLYHGPTLLYGVTATANISIDTTDGTVAQLPNVHVIMQTGLSGIIVDHTPLTFPMAAHTNGAEGHFAMCAVETNIGGMTNKLCASSAAPYGDYEPMWSDEYKTVPLNGSLFVKRMIVWLATAQVVGLDLMTLLLIGGVIAVIIIIIIIIIVCLRRRK